MSRLDPLLLRRQLLALPDAARVELLSELGDDVVVALAEDWAFRAREKQLPPVGEWLVWLILAGRGFGKTRTGAETVRAWAREHPGCRIALVARTAADVRDVMVEGESGIMNLPGDPDFRPTYEPSKRRITWPNGSQATTFSADEPAALRGPQHHFAWADELAAWPYEDAWDQLMFGLRLGENPRVIVTTTPRPIKIIRELLAQAEQEGPSGSVRVTRGSTRENEANLAKPFLAKLMRKYQGTRLGRQELDAEVLTDTPGALWTRGLMERAREGGKVVPELKRVIIAIDPAVSTTAPDDVDLGSGKKGKRKSNETGILVVGLGVDDHGYVLDDQSGIYTPIQWARKVHALAKTFHADRIVAEINNGGDLVEANMRSVWPNVPYKGVHASRGKRTRAEPIAALYEQDRVHHSAAFPSLEDQCTTWTPDSGEESPDRMDALVWGLTFLMIPDEAPPPRGVVRSAAAGGRGRRWAGV